MTEVPFEMPDLCDPASRAVLKNENIVSVGPSFSRKGAKLAKPQSAVSGAIFLRSFGGLLPGGFM